MLLHYPAFALDESLGVACNSSITADMSAGGWWIIRILSLRYLGTCDRHNSRGVVLAGIGLIADSESDSVRFHKRAMCHVPLKAPILW